MTTSTTPVNSILDNPHQFSAPSWDEVQKIARSTTSTKTQYFSFVVHEVFHGVNAISISGFEVREINGKFIDKSAWRIHSVSNELQSHPASNLLDGNPETVWHTEEIAPAGHYVVIDMGKIYEIGSICYIPRQALKSSVNGRVKKYSLSIYTETSEWVSVKSGTFNPGRSPQDIVLSEGNERRDFIFISRKHSHIDDMSDKGFSMARADFECTGLYCISGQQFYIYLENDVPAGVTLELLVGAMHLGENPAPSRFPIKQGENTIIPDRDGLLFLYVIHPEKKYIIPVSFRNVLTAPYYVLGNTTKDQWASMLKNAAMITSAQLFSGKAMIAVSVSKAMEYMEEDIDQLLNEYNRIIDKADEACGINESNYSDGGIHLPSDSYYQFNQSSSDRVYMAAASYSLLFHRDVVQVLLSPKVLTAEGGWGAWHELGHAYQLPKMNGYHTVESTCNIISLAVEKMYGITPSWIDRYDGRTQAKEWLKGTNKNFETAGNMVSLVMYNELTELFGANFYPSVYQEYRRLLKDPSFIEDTALPESRNDIFAFMASKCAKKNLISHFDSWGFMLQEKTKVKIRALGYP
ncbi:M60 family metallopeptidase [Pseudomonas sp. HOU2]|uniref:M60 family metallopeptidase n=1 Tax=Pseudomonas sp. HOU2 TaxID=3230301 RepID=UPI00345B177C